MLQGVFTILLDVGGFSNGSNEDLWLLLTGVGLIVLVFVMRRWLSDGKND